jgi:hypothetical protein
MSWNNNEVRWDSLGWDRTGDAAPFVPSGSPYARYDASDLSYSDNDDVATWGDMIGSLDLLGPLGNRPVFKVNQQNGLPAVDFTAASEQIMAVAFGEIISQPNTIFMVWKYKTAANTVIMDGIDGNDRHHLYSAGEDMRIFANAALSSGVTSDSNIHLYSMLFNGGSSNCRIDKTDHTGQAGSDGCAGLTFGANYVPGTWSDIQIMEIIVYNGSESFTDNEAGLTTKWGLS